MSRSVHAGVLAALAALLALAVNCGGGGGTPSGPGPIQPPPPPPFTGTAVLVGAGDIADCANEGGRHAEDTAKLLDGIDGIVFAAGDLAYFDGSAAQFNNCYGPRWGRFRNRTYAVPGNHEYESAGAVPYYSYFGERGGPFGVGYYSYTLGAWHIVGLNSNLAAGIGSAQLLWLRDDLAGSAARCTLVYFHHPRFTSGPSGGGVMRDVWVAMQEFRVDVVLNGHDHFYERFGPQDADGRSDAATGIRQFVVGTGGAPLYPFNGRRPNSEFQIGAYGVLKLTLRPNDYDWTFIEATGTGAVRDTGSGICH